MGIYIEEIIVYVINQPSDSMISQSLFGKAGQLKLFAFPNLLMKITCVPSYHEIT